jgi:hypothetical protein
MARAAAPPIRIGSGRTGRRPRCIRHRSHVVEAILGSVPRWANLERAPPEHGLAATTSSSAHHGQDLTRRLTGQGPAARAWAVESAAEGRLPRPAVSSVKSKSSSLVLDPPNGSVSRQIQARLGSVCNELQAVGAQERERALRPRGQCGGIRDQSVACSSRSRVEKPSGSDSRGNPMRVLRRIGRAGTTLPYV